MFFRLPLIGSFESYLVTSQTNECSPTSFLNCSTWESTKRFIIRSEDKTFVNNLSKQPSFSDKSCSSEKLFHNICKSFHNFSSKRTIIIEETFASKFYRFCRLKLWWKRSGKLIFPAINYSKNGYTHPSDSRKSRTFMSISCQNNIFVSLARKNLLKENFLCRKKKYLFHLSK